MALGSYKAIKQALSFSPFSSPAGEAVYAKVTELFARHFCPKIELSHKSEADGMKKEQIKLIKKYEAIYPSYAMLLGLVFENKIKIIYELSLPRSNSTAWQIALCESPDVHGQINEPSFHSDFQPRRHDYINHDAKETRSFEDYCSRILERINVNIDKGRKSLNAESKDETITLVVNDLVHSVTTEELELILNLTAHVMVTVRDPRAQGYSALQRIINDTLDSPGGSNINRDLAMSLSKKTQISHAELAKLVGPGPNKINPAWILQSQGLSEDESLTPEILQKAINQAVEKCAKEYVGLCWENLSHHIDTINKYFNNKGLSIIDGDALLNNPDEIMRQSSRVVGVTFSEAMVSDWKKATKENFYCCITADWGEFAFTNAWNGPVRNSTRYEKKPNSISEIKDISQFPQAMQSYLQDALAQYREIMVKPGTLILGQKRNEILDAPITPSNVLHAYQRSDEDESKSAVTTSDSTKKPISNKK